MKPAFAQKIGEGKSTLGVRLKPSHQKIYFKESIYGGDCNCRFKGLVEIATFFKNMRVSAH